MLILTVDNETWAFSDSCQTPPAICLSYCEIIQVPNAALTAGFEYKLGRADVLPYFRGRGPALDAWHAWLTMAAAGEAMIIGAHISYDVLTTIVSAYFRSPEFGRELFRLFVAAYDRNAITDVFGRQKLLDLACGCYRYEYHGTGKPTFHGYGLKHLARRHLGVDLDKDNPWRTRFGELEWIEPSRYPDEARQYSLDDAISTAGVWIAQETSGRGGRADPRIQRNFPGRDPLVNQFETARASLVLTDISAYGLRTDPRGVEEFAQEVQAAHREACDELVAAGLVRREYTANRAGFVQYVKAKGLEGSFGKTPSGGLSATGAALRATRDPALALLADWRAISAILESDESPPEKVAQAEACAKYLVSAGLATCKEPRDTKAAKRRQFDAYLHPERLKLDSGPRPVPRTDKWDPWDEERKKGNPKHTPDSLECVKLDGEACDASEDHLMKRYAEFSSLGKALSTDLVILRQGLHNPIHSRFEEMLETGRTSSSKPNVQNVRRLPGIRECFVPRAGRVFVDVDYPSLELHTLAQVCYWNIGHSILGDALKAGKDPHLQMAATILGRTYNDCKEHKKDPDVSNARTCGKGVNFGAPGGLGKATFAVYVYKSYGIRLCDTMRAPEGFEGEWDEPAAAARLIQQYKDTWTEMPAYFQWVNGMRGSTFRVLLDEDGNEKKDYRYNVVQPWSGRLRAGATYCAASNSPFQGLGADVAKAAMWLVFKAQHGFSELGEADPLFGSHVVNFVHDQLISEVEESRASAAGWRLAELMTLAGKLVMPDTKMTCEPTSSRQWSKKAETIYEASDGGRTSSSEKARRDPNGNPVIVPWDLHQACDDAVTKLRAKTNDPEQLRLALVRDEWPTYVIRDALERAQLPLAA